MIRRLAAVALLAATAGGCSHSIGKSDPKNLDIAAKECGAHSANIGLTSNHAIDSRPFWIFVLKDKESRTVVECLDRWSIDHLGSGAQLVDVLPQRQPTTADFEKEAEAMANSLADNDNGLAK